MSVSPPAKVLVTGANGFISVWICRLLLEQGYSVRGTVRDDGKGEYLRKLFGPHGREFEYVIVKDISKDGAFDEAVTGVDAVIHTASPVSFGSKPEELIPPAVNGTLTILRSVMKFGTRVRRVVMTSSAAALLEQRPEGHIYTEDDWNETVVRELNEKGDDTDAVTVYRASKVLAEKAAWDFVEEEQPLKWKLVAILPTYVWGPLLQDTSTLKGPNASLMLMYDSITKEKPAEELGNSYSDWVDVRDTALAHVLAIQKEAAGGNRFIISGGFFAWQDIYDALQSAEPPLPRIPCGRPGVARSFGTPCSSELSKKVLGIEYRSLRECVTDAVVSIRTHFPDM